MVLKKELEKIISTYLCRFKNVQDFFVVSACNMPKPDKNSVRKYFDIDNYADFEQICERFGFTVPDADAKKRFSENSHFALITEDNHFGCWGWYTTKPKEFYVLEIDSESVIPPDTSILYHYFSNENYRRKGYYVELLQNVVASCKKDYAVIYAYDTNPASSGAIRKAGFKYMGRFGHKNFDGLGNLVEKYKAEVMKK